MLLVVIGITYGAVVGIVGHLILFRSVEAKKIRGVVSLKGVGGVFFFRYVLDALALIVFALITRDGLGITSAALSITVAVKISLLIAYTRKGGRMFD